MYHLSTALQQTSFMPEIDIECDWPALKGQLLSQWKHITPQELESTGPNHRCIAMLIQRKYGISAELVENYLHNFERTMPLSLGDQEFAVS
jgi:hypothetical protein